MARLFDSDVPLCASGIGGEMYGVGFDNSKGQKILRSLVALERWGFAEFSHFERPPGNGKPMKFFYASSEAWEVWPRGADKTDWSTALTEALGEEMDRCSTSRSADRARKALMALAKPRGRAILSFFMEMGEASASEVAASLSIKLPTAADQVRRLADAGLIVHCDTDIRKGALMKVYRPSLPEWASVALQEAQQGLSV